MKHPYTGIWLILSTSLILFTFISCFDSVNLWGYELKKSSIYEDLTHKDIAVDSALILAENEEILKPDTVVKIEKDTLPKSILFIGDSMLEGLGPRMAAYAKYMT